MGDLNKRRGRVLGMNPVSGGRQVIEADVPMTGMFGYCTTLRSMTGGRGTYEYASRAMSRHLTMCRRRRLPRGQRRNKNTLLSIEAFPRNHR